MLNHSESISLYFLALCETLWDFVGLCGTSLACIVPCGRRWEHNVVPWGVRPLKARTHLFAWNPCGTLGHWNMLGAESFQSTSSRYLLTLMTYGMIILCAALQLLSDSRFPLALTFLGQLQSMYHEALPGHARTCLGSSFQHRRSKPWVGNLQSKNLISYGVCNSWGPEPKPAKPRRTNERHAHGTPPRRGMAWSSVLKRQTQHSVCENAINYDTP